MTDSAANLDLHDVLAAVDWTFPSTGPIDPLQGLHPYPAKFIPQIPGTLLDILPFPSGTTVLDPFVGSGTTMVEAQRRGMPSVGIDLNPIACLISRVKTEPLPVGIGEAISRVVDEASRPSDSGRNLSIPRVDHWFRRDVQVRLAALGRAIGKEPEELRDPLNLALSAIIVKVSNQESDTRYAAIAKSTTGPDVIPSFEKSASRIVAALESRSWNVGDSRVIQGDAQKICPADLPEEVGAIITSPPYPNAYEYWLYHKYRMYWLDHDPLPVREAEIGARPHFFKADPHTPSHFQGQMRRVLEPGVGRLVSGGWLCVVVGRSRIHGQIIDNAAIVSAVADSLGLDKEADIVREIAASRKSFNLSHARIKTENVLVFRKP